MQYVQSNTGLFFSVTHLTCPGKASCSDFRASIPLNGHGSLLPCLALTNKPDLEYSWLGVLPCRCMDSEERGTPTGCRRVGVPGTTRSFFGKKFWTISWPFLKFFKSFWTAPAHPPACQPSATKCGCRLGVVDTDQPSSVCQRGKRKSFSTRLRAGSVRVRPSEKSAKERSIPLVVAVVCLRAFATCCTELQTFQTFGRDAIPRRRDTIFRSNFVSTPCDAEDDTQMDGPGILFSSRKAFPTFRRRFAHIYISRWISLQHRPCQVADLHTYPHPPSVLGTGAAPGT